MFEVGHTRSMELNAKIDPVQPRMQDHSELYLRLSVPAVRDLRNTLMTSLAMSPSMRARSNEKLFLLGMIDRQGELTNMGAFVAELGCQPENAALLWYCQTVRSHGRRIDYLCHNGKRSRSTS